MGDKSELPLLAVTPTLTASSSDCTDAVDTDTQNCVNESQLSGLAISAAAGTDSDGEISDRSRDVECHWPNVDVGVNLLESVVDTDAAVEVEAEAGALAAAYSSNCEAEAELVTDSADGSDAKGEVIQLFRHIYQILLFTEMSNFLLSLALSSSSYTLSLVEISFCSLQHFF